MSDSLKSKLARIEAKIQPPIDTEAEEQKQRSEEIERLLKEQSELNRLEAIEDQALSPKERYDKELAIAEELAEN